MTRKGQDKPNEGEYMTDPGVPTAQAQTPPPIGPKPRILYAEDEPLIAALLEDSLSEAGFEVLLAPHGNAAAALLEDQGGTLAALVTDIQLREGPSGWELARRAREIDPGVPVIYTTGDSAHLWAQDGVPLSVVIQKPFVDAQVITALANLLNGAGAMPGSL
jgi:CheY-like chemotaxis protein